MVQPRLARVDSVPMRPLAGGQQEVDRGSARAAIIHRRTTPGLDEVTTFGMGLHPEPADDLGRFHPRIVAYHLAMPTAATRAPAAWLRVLESRAVLEMGAGAVATPWLRRAARGDGHPVLVLPGFLTDDRATAALRFTLQGQGYAVSGWGAGRNLGPTPDTVDAMRERLQELHGRHNRPVSIVGLSLGGLYARRLAQRVPEMIRQVITLGSPFRMSPDDRSALSPVFERLRPTFVPVDESLPPLDGSHLPVPATSIYTRTDGVVRWWQCLESEGPGRENIEVRGSHSGLGFNPAAVYAVGDRLAQPADAWRPFRRPAGSGALFPTPANSVQVVSDTT